MSNMVNKKRAQESAPFEETPADSVLSAEELSHLIGETLVESEGKKTPNASRTVHYIRAVGEVDVTADILPEVVAYINEHSDFVVVKIDGSYITHGYKDSTEAINAFNSLA